METQTHVILNDEEKLRITIENNAKNLADSFTQEELSKGREAIKTEFRKYLSEHPSDTTTTPKRENFQRKLKTYSRAIEMKTTQKG